jgi:lysyl-tRNA synthetase class II
MSTNPLNEAELAEILQIAQAGEQKLREMSDRSTIIAEKWRLKTQSLEPIPVKTESKITLA